MVVYLVDGSINVWYHCINRWLLCVIALVWFFSAAYQPQVGVRRTTFSKDMATMLAPDSAQSEHEAGPARVTVTGVQAQEWPDACSLSQSRLNDPVFDFNSSSFSLIGTNSLSPYSMPGVVFSPGKLSPTPSCKSVCIQKVFPVYFLLLISL